MAGAYTDTCGGHAQGRQGVPHPKTTTSRRNSRLRITSPTSNSRFVPKGRSTRLSWRKDTTTRMVPLPTTPRGTTTRCIKLGRLRSGQQRRRPWATTHSSLMVLQRPPRPPIRLVRLPRVRLRLRPGDGGGDGGGDAEPLCRCSKSCKRIPVKVSRGKAE